MNCDDIRDAIEDWFYAALPSPWLYDHYCLLVDNLEKILLCNNPDEPGLDVFGLRTEDLYASMNGDDLDDEVYLGRLSYYTVKRNGVWIDELQVLQEQVDRILHYEDYTSPLWFSNAHQVALVAHQVR